MPRASLDDATPAEEAPSDAVSDAAGLATREMTGVTIHAMSESYERLLADAIAGDGALFRIGDAVAARNTHAAIYDGLRLAKDL